MASDVLNKAGTLLIIKHLAVEHSSLAINIKLLLNDDATVKDRESFKYLSEVVIVISPVALYISRLEVCVFGFGFGFGVCVCVCMCVCVHVCVCVREGRRERKREIKREHRRVLVNDFTDKNQLILAKHYHAKPSAR